jgi:hypothetical protein
MWPGMAGVYDFVELVSALHIILTLMDADPRERAFSVLLYVPVTRNWCRPSSSCLVSLIGISLVPLETRFRLAREAGYEPRSCPTDSHMVRYDVFGRWCTSATVMSQYEGHDEGPFWWSSQFLCLKSCACQFCRLLAFG